MAWIKNNWLLVSLTSVALFLSGCAGLQTPEGQTQSAWLNAPFTLNGKLAVRYPECDEYRGCKQKASSAQMSWDHRAHIDKIGLYDPLGQAVFSLDYQGDSVTVTDKNGTQTLAVDELSKRLGFALPIAKMQSWLFTKAPQEQFTSDGWEVSVSRWQAAGYYQLLTLKQGKYFLRLYTSSLQKVK